MKPGMVTQIRVNTKDCLGILELMGVLGIDPYDGRSFAQCVSLALSSMLQTMRDRGVISAEEDGFQYLNKMGPFIGSRNDRRKYVMSNTLSKRMGEGTPSMQIPTHNVKDPGQFIPQAISGWTEHGQTTSAAQQLPLDDETKILLAEELGTLYAKENAGEELSPEEKERFQYLNKILYT